MTTCDDGDESREGWGWGFLFSFFSHTRGCQHVSIVWRVCVCACVVSIDKFLMLIGIIQIDRSTDLEVYHISKMHHKFHVSAFCPICPSGPFSHSVLWYALPHGKTLNGVKCLVTIELCHPRSCRLMSTTWTRLPSAWKSLMGVMTVARQGAKKTGKNSPKAHTYCGNFHVRSEFGSLWMFMATACYSLIAWKSLSVFFCCFEL